MQSQANNTNQSWYLFGGIALGGIVMMCGLLAALGYWFLGGTSTPIAPPPSIPTLPVATDLPIQPTQPPPIGAPTITLPAPATLPPANAADVQALAATTPPTIDGNLAEWPTGNEISSAFRVYNISSWDGTSDLTAVWRLQWDATHLYFAVDVTDNIHVQTQTGNRSYQGDSLEVQIDTQLTADYAPRVSPDDYQFIFSPGNFANLPPEAYRFQGTSANGLTDAPGHTVIIAALPKANGGYTLEAAVPWANLNITPQSNNTYGLALSANDNDTPNSAAQEVMLSHVASRALRDPTSWGRLVLR